MVFKSVRNVRKYTSFEYTAATLFFERLNRFFAFLSKVHLLVIAQDMSLSNSTTFSLSFMPCSAPRELNNTLIFFTDDDRVWHWNPILPHRTTRLSPVQFFLVCTDDIDTMSSIHLGQVKNISAFWTHINLNYNVQWEGLTP